MGIDRHFEEARAALEDVERHLDAGVVGRSAPAVSGWTVGQQLVHVSLVAQSVATALKVMLRRGGEATESSEEARAILASGVIPRGVAKAPDALARTEPPEEDEIRTALEKAKKRWEELADRAADLEATAGSLPHPLLGPLDASEWVRFAGVHGRHHLAIVDEILGVA